MRNRTALVTGFFCVLVLLLSVFPHATADAATFANLFVRLDRTKATSPLSGLVCARPSAGGAGTEAKVQIQFPSDFTIHTSVSNWTADTSSIPSGSTAWPGIGNLATSVSGKTVTFAGGDLASSSLYCFTFTGVDSSTGSTGNKIGSVSTKDSSDTTIDTNQYSVRISSNDEVTVTANVQPDSADFSTTIEKVSSDTTFRENMEINYKITYRSHLAVSFPIVVQAEWDEAAVVDDPPTTYDILSYVIGSASDGYQSAPPVIDPVNRRISWTIPSYPGNDIPHSVQFSLKTNDAYTGSKKLSFTVASRIISLGTQTTDSTVTAFYQYGFSPTPIPQTAVATPTPSPSQPSAITINTISIQEISSFDSTITVALESPGTVSISYGPFPSSLTKTVTSDEKKLIHTLRLDELTENTTYYFRITAVSESGQQTASDLFTFITARLGTQPKIQEDAIIVTSNDTILYDPRFASFFDKPLVILGQGLPYKFRMSFAEADLVKEVRAFVRTKYILGSSLIQPSEVSTTTTILTEIGKGIYTGSLQAPRKTDVYSVFARIVDTNGAISEKFLFDLKVSPNFTVVNKDTNTPIESAEVTVFLYNERSRIYERITSQTFLFNNPSYTQPNGQIQLPLPPGQYKAEVVALGYKNYTVLFTLGSNAGENFPTVYLTPEPFNLVTYIRYLTTILIDLGNAQDSTVGIIAQSQRFAELLSYIILTLFVIMTFLSFHSRAFLPFESLLQIKHFFTSIFTTHKMPLLIIKGTVIDTEKKVPLSGSEVYLMKRDSQTVLSQTKSNKQGKFVFSHLSAGHYRIMVLSHGFAPEMLFADLHEDTELLATMDRQHQKYSLRHKLVRISKDFMAISFEILIFISFSLEISLGVVNGFERVFPFLIASTFNLLLWIFYTRHKRSHGI